MPVWLISSGSQPWASAWVTSPGEQASIPTASSEPGRAEPAEHPQDRGIGRGLEREPHPVRDAGAPERGLELADVLGRPGEVVDEQRRPVLAGERLEVGAVEGQAPVEDVEPGAPPPGRGADGDRLDVEGHDRASADGATDAGRAMREGRAGRAARIAARVTGSANGSGPSATSVPIASRRCWVACAISSTASRNASAFLGRRLAEAADLADVLEGGRVRPRRWWRGRRPRDGGAGGCFGTCAEGYRATRRVALAQSVSEAASEPFSSARWRTMNTSTTGIAISSA